MKKLLLAALVIFASSTMTMAQNAKQDAKDYNSIAKNMDKTTVKKLEKQAKAEAKAQAKDGWKPATGGLPLEEQLYAYYIKQQDATVAEENGKTPKFMFAQSMAKGSNYSAARKQAMELARVELAGEISSKTAEIIKQNVMNAELSAEETTSLSKTVSESKTIVQQNLGRVSVGYEAYREVDGKYQVAIRLQYSTRNLTSTLATVLANESEKVRSEVDKLLSVEEE